VPARRRRRQARSLQELRPNAKDLLREFTNPAGAYAFTTYDNTPVHDGPLTPGDIFMANLLSLKLGWQKVIPLFADGSQGGGTVWTKLRLDLDAALTEARQLCSEHDRFVEADVAMPKLDELNNYISDRSFTKPTGRRQRTWTEVTVSKVLHRLSPNIPLIDSRSGASTRRDPPRRSGNASARTSSTTRIGWFCYQSGSLLDAGRCRFCASLTF
jgi:hypothetical protein